MTKRWLALVIARVSPRCHLRASLFDGLVDRAHLWYLDRSCGPHLLFAQLVGRARHSAVLQMLRQQR